MPRNENPSGIRSRVRRKKWLWVTGILLVVGSLSLVGLNEIISHGDTYIADLTAGNRDFRIVHTSSTETFYRPDGLHIRITRPGAWSAPIGLTATSGHPALSIAISATELHVESPSGLGPGIGPWCFDGEGYGFMHFRSGLSALVRRRSDGAVTVLTSHRGSPWLTGKRAILTIQCSTDSGKVTLRSFLNGKFVVGATRSSSITEFQSGGFVGFAPTSSGVTTEWTVSKYWRLPPASLPE